MGASMLAAVARSSGVPSHDGRNGLSQLTFISSIGSRIQPGPRQAPAPARQTWTPGDGREQIWRGQGVAGRPGAPREGVARGGPDPDRLARPPSPRTRPRHVSPVLRERRRRHRPGEDPDRRPRHDQARRRRSGRLHPGVVDASPPRGEPGRWRRLRHERRVDHRQHRLRPGRLQRRRPRRLRRVPEGRARRLRSRSRQQRQHHLRSHRRGGRRVAPRGGHAARLRRPAARVRRRSPRRGRPRQPWQRQLPRWPADGVPRLRPVPRHRRREARRRIGVPVLQRVDRRGQAVHGPAVHGERIHPAVGSLHPGRQHCRPLSPRRGGRRRGRGRLGRQQPRHPDVRRQPRRAGVVERGGSAGLRPARRPRGGHLGRRAGGGDRACGKPALRRGRERPDPRVPGDPGR